MAANAPTQRGASLPSPRLVYITARGHSGSTLLEMMIGAHPAVASLGELKALATKRDNPCRCGAPTFSSCPYWKEVDVHLRASSPFRLAEIDTEVADAASFAAQNLALLGATARAAGVGTVVDSSKSLRRLERLDALGMPIEVVVLSRSPLGVVSSNLRRGRDWREESRSFTIATMKTRDYLAGRPVHHLSYEALVADPEATLARLMAGLGLELVPEQLDWARQPCHTFAGNAMRFSRESTIRRDERWRRELSLAQKIGILWLTLPTRMRTSRLYEAHLPYWKGEGREAWRTYRADRRAKARRLRRYRWLERFPVLRPVHARLRALWRRLFGAGEA